MKHRSAMYERPLPQKVIGSLLFGFLGFITVQVHLINILDEHMHSFWAYAIAYVLTGQIVFFLDYFGARHKLFTGHFQNIDWHEFFVSWLWHNGLSVFGAAINGSVLVNLASGHALWQVFLANGISGILTQAGKWLIVHSDLKNRLTRVRREE